MTKRANGEGNIWHWEAKNLWRARLPLPDHRFKTKYLKTQKDAKDWLREESQKLSRGIFIRNEDITVEAYLRQFLAEHAAKGTIRVTTLSSYREMIERHIIPELGKIKLSKLRPDQLDRFYTQKLEAISPTTNKHLSNRTVQYLHGLLKAAFNKAINKGLMVENPAKKATPPKVKKMTPSTMNPDQVKCFLDSLEGDRWRAIYFLAIATGMRKGEILGLPLSALDLEKGYLHVFQSLQAIRGQGKKLLDPKTDQSRRTIRLPAFAIEALEIHLAHRAVIATSPRWEDSGLVFTTDIGTSITPRNLLRDFKAKLEAAGLPHMRFHDLRHTAASLLLSENVHPKIVQEMLGHSTVTLTMNTYSHILNPMGTVAADAMEHVVGNGKK